MGFISEFFRDGFRSRDVAVLRAFVAAAKQDHDDLAALNEIDPIARSVIDAKLADALADRFDITGIAKRESTNSDVDPVDGPSIAKFGNPLRIGRSLSNFEYAYNILYTMWDVKWFAARGLRLVQILESDIAEKPIWLRSPAAQAIGAP
jgi:hypothetical protein